MNTRSKTTMFLGALVTAAGLSAILFPLACGKSPTSPKYPEPEPPPRAHRPVKVQIPLGTQLDSNHGHAQTWDGRVFVIGEELASAGGKDGWIVRVLRPENIRADNRGAPRFDSSTFSTGKILGLETVPAGGRTAPDQIDVGPGLAVTPAPGFLENPFKSDQAGNPNDQGRYATYELLVFCNFTGPIGQRRAQIIIKDPETPQAEVESTKFLGPAVNLSHGPNDEPLLGIEPTVTQDGRLIIFQGDPPMGAQQIPNTFFAFLTYAWNPTPGSPGGWSTPRNVGHMHWVDRDVLVDGIPFHERFPVAKQPMRSADGQVYGPADYYRGAYPWITKDGTELFHTGVGRAAVTVVGRLTAWTAEHVDGPINPDRDMTQRLFFSSPGLAPGMWKPYRGVRGVPIPYTGGRAVYPVFGTPTNDYGEVSFQSHDGDYVVYLPMNELVGYLGSYDSSRTPDTSGRFNTGMLENAQFPMDFDGVDRNRGAVGNSVFFGDDSGVRVPFAASLEEARRELTVELFVKRLTDDASISRTLASRDGAWQLVLEPDHRIRASVTVNGQDLSSGPVGTPLTKDTWTHVAFSWDAASGCLVVYQDGRPVSTLTLTAGQIDPCSQDLLVGPASRNGSGVGGATLMLDQVAVSRVVRTPQELATAAFVSRSPAVAVTANLALPTGLDSDDLRLPAPVDAEQAALGKKLFFETGLSGSGSTSCADCHQPSLGFADGRSLARGKGGQTLDRHTPVAFNRAFSTLQFWDGRSATLEDQALKPITNPKEMDSTVADAVAFLQGDPTYPGLFQQAFGQPPSGDTIARALAAYERTLVSGDSAVDRYEAGTGTLTQSERRGRILFSTKARCIGCHDGSNYTDERFHDTASSLSLANDLGRAAITYRFKDRGAFKTPTLRGLSQSAPYLHDGSAQTLEEVVDLYDAGGRAGRRDEVERDPEIRPLGLTATEKADLVAYLKALDGRIIEATVHPVLASPAPTTATGPFTTVAPTSSTAAPSRQRGPTGSTTTPPLGSSGGGGGCTLTPESASAGPWSVLAGLVLLVLLRRQGSWKEQASRPGSLPGQGGARTASPDSRPG